MRRRQRGGSFQRTERQRRAALRQRGGSIRMSKRQLMRAIVRQVAKKANKRPVYKKQKGGIVGWNKMLSSWRV